jgi:hypothetical protein
MIDFSNTFDTTNALSGMYLWILFGYLAALLNCDLQRFLKSHPIIIHLVGLLTFFFLFTLIDSANKTSVINIWIKTIFIYILFVLTTKSKWYFVVPVLVILLIDQTLKKDLSYKKQVAEDKEATGKKLTPDEIKKLEEHVNQYSSFINKAIIVIIICGVIHYMYLQYIEYGNKFSFYKFFLGVTRCKDKMPVYKT